MKPKNFLSLFLSFSFVLPAFLSCFVSVFSVEDHLYVMDTTGCKLIGVRWKTFYISVIETNQLMLCRAKLLFVLK